MYYETHCSPQTVLSVSVAGILVSVDTRKSTRFFTDACFGQPESQVCDIITELEFSDTSLPEDFQCYKTNTMYVLNTDNHSDFKKS